MCYALMPLEQLRGFIEQYKHLPGIEDAATVQKEGIELGDMNKKLLQKVEELTLYLLEKDKEIKALNEKVAQLATAVKQ
jgi:hypothetical protein